MIQTFTRVCFKHLFFFCKSVCYQQSPAYLCFQVSDNSEANKMTNSNLAVVFGPNLLWGQDNAMTLSAIGPINNFTRTLLDQHHLVFPWGPSHRPAVFVQVWNMDAQSAFGSQQHHYGTSLPTAHMEILWTSSLYVLLVLLFHSNLDWLFDQK